MSEDQPAVDPDRERFSAEQELGEEHSAIRALLHWIEEDLEVESTLSTGIRSDGALLAPLKSLQDHLKRHFEFEERCGVIESVMKTLPDAEDAIRRWRQEHTDMLVAFDLCIHELETAAAEGRNMEPSFGEDLNRLFSTLRRHDAFENHVLGERSEDFRSAQSHLEK